MTNFVETLLTKSPESDKVITLCGSARNRKAIRGYEAKLIQQGYIVLTPAEPALSAWSDEQIERLHHNHDWKLKQAKVVLVVCPDGYFGKDTAREIVYASNLGKVITFTDDPSCESSNTLYEEFRKIYRTCWIEDDHLYTKFSR